MRGPLQLIPYCITFTEANQVKKLLRHGVKFPAVMRKALQNRYLCESKYF
jgi:hypothetical protein